MYLRSKHAVPFDLLRLREHPTSTLEPTFNKPAMIRTTSVALRPGLPAALRASPTICSFATSCRRAKTDEPDQEDKDLQAHPPEADLKSAPAKKKTVAEADAEMMEKLAGISGDGGASGVEYEDGKPAAMKRSVKNNMFRLI
jgi:hypothetical protein